MSHRKLSSADRRLLHIILSADEEPRFELKPMEIRLRALARAGYLATTDAGCDALSQEAAE